MARTGQLTPMLRHYLETKTEHADAILMYRMGDFYEMFFEDAEIAAPVLEIALTARQKGTASEAPMCGIPHHALPSYLGKLVRAGFKVAICDQTEDPAHAEGLVRREVTRVVTPGTVSEPGLLESKADNLLCALSWENGVGAGAFLDVSTGKFLVYRWRSPEEALEDLTLLRPPEVLFGDGDVTPPALRSWIEKSGVCGTPLAPEDQLTGRRAEQILEDQFSSSLRGFGLQKGEPAIRASATALLYARQTQRSELGHVREIVLHDAHKVMTVDETTVRNLDLLRNQSDGTERTTLLSLLDRTQTSMGGRLFREWMLRPLLDLRAIQARHDAVGELVEREDRRLDLRARLATIADLERLLSRAVLGSLSPREASALRDSLAACPQLLSSLSACRSDLLAAAASIDPAKDLAAVLDTTLEEEPAASLKAGGVIAEGVNPELDECRSLARDSKQHILALEAEERKKTGISSLKIGFNRVFGYYIEVTKSHLERVPEEYVRKQTLVNAERFITPELKELEEEILSAEEKQLRLEQEEFEQLVETVARAAEPLQTLAAFLAATDVLAAFAEVAAQRGYCRPTMEPRGAAIVMREGRHPIVEEAISEEFVPNDCDIDREEAQIILLTGPNMGGKSTYLRQIALAVLMAQMGSFVAASEARLGLVDRLFTRVGASDDLARGESTFMVEMIETANILRYATADSLLILDEVGRGTATFDGLSLAWAIVEYLHRGERPKTVFATHYHELTELAVLAGVKNFTLAVKEWDDRIVFLRRVVAGSADKSYGIHVARLAGLPPEVLERATEVLSNLERNEYDLRGRPRLARGRAGPAPEGPDQLALFTPPEELVASVLRDVDLERLTPLAALNLLHSLRARLNGE